MGDARGFGRILFGTKDDLMVVLLPELGHCGDGEESSVCTNLAVPLTRPHCCLEQH